MLTEKLLKQCFSCTSLSTFFNLKSRLFSYYCCRHKGNFKMKAVQEKSKVNTMVQFILSIASVVTYSHYVDKVSLLFEHFKQKYCLNLSNCHFKITYTQIKQVCKLRQAHLRNIRGQVTSQHPQHDILLFQRDPTTAVGIYIMCLIKLPVLPLCDYYHWSTSWIAEW